MEAEQVIIIGAGPAGLATAIQLKRYGVTPLLFERAQAGGLLWNANLVENYPGFPSGITGPDLVGLFVRQAQHLSIDVTHEEVIELVYEQEMFQVRSVQTSYSSRLVVIATGTKPQRLKDLSIPADVVERVFYEVYELLQAEGKHIVIVGSGDAAFDYALNLSRKNRITILNRGAQTRCLPLLWQRAQNVSTITYHPQTAVSRLMKDLQDGMLLDCQGPAGGLQFHADYLVGAIGRVAQVDFLPETFLQQTTALEEQGVLYRIGDVKNGIYRQTAIAVGEGVMTAMKIYRRLKETR